LRHPDIKREGELDCSGPDFLYGAKLEKG
jgi:hypothetical protein